MLYLVTGGSASGKSAYAEEIACSFRSEKTYYIATMQPYGEEGKKRIARHRAMRAKKGFETIECFRDIGNLKLCMGGKNCSILLECVSNLTANEVFSGYAADGEIIHRIVNGIYALSEHADRMVAVTNEVFSDLSAYSSETVRYMHILGEINRCLARLADKVWEIVYGIPVLLKDMECKTTYPYQDAPDGRKHLLDQRKLSCGGEGSVGMVFVTGGAFQGKRKCARELLHISEEDYLCGLADGNMHSGEAAFHAPYIAACHSFIRKAMSAGMDAEAYTRKLILANPAVISMDEVGYGIVPIEKSDRDYRETAGRCGQLLAASASEVYRVVCGIPMRLK